MEAEERSSPKKQGATMAELRSVRKSSGGKGDRAITGPAPWPAAGGKHEYVAHILEDTPPNARKALQPAEDTEEGAEEKATMEDEEVMTSPSAPLTQDLCAVMDMTATDNDGFETTDTSKEINLLKDKDKTIRRQRPQGEEEEEGTANARSRSRPQPPKGEPPSPQYPQNKRSLKGARSDPDDAKHLSEYFKQSNDLVTGKAWNNWKNDDKDIAVSP